MALPQIFFWDRSYPRTQIKPTSADIYIENIPLDRKGKELRGAKRAKGREYIKLLFKVRRSSLPDEEKKQKRQEASRPILDAFWESAIRPFATARRAWLFADTPKGAKASAVLYTLAESARANDLDIFEYLKYLLMEMPNNRHLEHPEVI